MVEKSQGQIVLERAESFVRRYVAFPENLKDQALVVALWAISTWHTDRIGSAAFLSVVAPTKGAGKTLCMQVVGLLCRGFELLATIRPVSLVRCIEGNDCKCTIATDEAEKLASAAYGDTRSIYAGGYRAGSTHGVVVGKVWTKFRTFCPKMFATIGDCLTDVIRDRCVVIRLVKATPEASFWQERNRAEAEAMAIRGEMRYLDLPFTEPGFLQDREREIWTSLFTVAAALKLDGAMMGRLERIAMDLVALKSGPRMRATEASEDDNRAAIQAMTDLKAIFREGERHVFSAVAVERMKEIATSPWRHYLGEGLDEIKLSALVNRFGVNPIDGRMVSGRGAKRAAVRKGYRAADVRAAKV